MNFTISFEPSDATLIILGGYESILAASSYRDEAHYEDIETTVIKDSRGEEYRVESDAVVDVEPGLPLTRGHLGAAISSHD